MDISIDTSTDTDVDTNTTISIDPEDHSSPMLIDVIDLTKESPRNRPSQSRYRYTENACTSRHATRSSRRLSHREVLTPIAIGRRYDIEPDYLGRIRTHSDSANDNEIVNLDNTIEVRDDKEEADKQDNKDNEQEGNKCYTFQSDDKVPVSLTCPICFEILSSRLKPTTTRCGHLFCAKCLKKSIHKYKHCPTCKTTITLKSCIRLYL